MNKQNEEFEPELGQMLFGQSFREFEVSHVLKDTLFSISSVLDVLNDLKDDNPFKNTGASFKNEVFEVEAYSWKEDDNQLYNFKWNEIEISWYKYLGRGMSVNRKINGEKCKEMLKSCLISLL